MNIRLVLIITAAAFVLNGCALPQLSLRDAGQSAAEKVSGASEEPVSMERLAAVDLVNALMQIEEYHPTGEPIQMHQADRGFGQVLRVVLETAGYQLEIIQGDSPRLIKFDDEIKSDRENTNSYEINVGSIRLKRDYQSVGGKIMPASYLYVRGTSVSRLTLNDQIFDYQQIETRTKPQLPANTAEAEKPESDEKLADSIEKEIPPTQPASKTPVALWVNGQGDSRLFSRKEKLTLTVQSVTDAELFCYYRDAGNVVMRVYPNRFSTQSYVDAGKVLKIPSVSDWSIEAADSAATEEFMCIASDASQQALIKLIKESPDFEPLPVTNFEELLAQLDKASGVQPTSARIAVKTN